ncbi:TonB-dependent receptor [Phenylobacterium hankyongense]|uniref:TonB-dependent receptor n=1 Tax=Phenylobacterium hankyongense TaxID=1813876 RepID=A0A328AVT9_9CAUL|nr:TonB-dependent receptor [Phenylobacterium hankyongense]RAK59242.1 TonB-dependent receptor [Phenylobacterium hankyongense]
MKILTFLLAGAAIGVLGGRAPARAEEAPAQLSGVTVVARSPLSEAQAERDEIPAAAVTLDAADLQPGQGSALLQALERRAPGVALSDAQANPYQPNLVYRGFEASPLQGSAQGVAVYVDGVRFNQPFGDTVNWDLIPEAAIRALTLEGSNPVFGLNALGGSLSVRLRDGFSDPGGSATLSAGSFGARNAEVAYGRADGDLGLYVAASARDEDGWRDFSPSRVRQVYADLGLRHGPVELHAGLIAADNDLTGTGPAPVELLAADRRAVFTYPDETRNHFGLLRLSGDVEASPDLTLQARAYVGRLRQQTRNGDATDAAPCDADPALLCLEAEGPVLTDAAGAPIGDVLHGGPYAQLNVSDTRTTSSGAAAQLVWSRPLLGRANSLTAGASLDMGWTAFSAQSLLGALTADRGFAGMGGGGGVLVDQPGGPITPVALGARTRYAGLYVSDVWQAGPRLALTLSGRLNRAEIRLSDHRGTALDGDHSFTRFNPAAGLTYRLGGGVSGYLSYAQANRAPAPAELSCASAQAPCSLTNFFVADPPLKQVRAQTVEAGLRGRHGAHGLSASWSLGVFRTATADDISLVASEVRGRGYFQNVGRTRRQGVEAQGQLERGAFSAYASYALTDATFRSPLVLNSPDNPAADAGGQIFVRPGDALPGVARQRLKLGLSYAPEPWRVALDVTAASGQILFGDEANLQPRLPGYVVANLSAGWRLTPAMEMFLAVRNLTDARYATFGTFAQTDQVALAEAPGAANPRSLSPAAPRSVLAGLRLTF